MSENEGTRERAGLGGICRELGTNELAFTPQRSWKSGRERERGRGDRFLSEQPWSAHLQLKHSARTAASAFLQPSGKTVLGCGYRATFHFP